MKHRRPKRRRDEHDANNLLGVGATLSQMEMSEQESASPHATADNSTSRRDDTKDSEDWQVVESNRSKRMKRSLEDDGDNYPSISHSANSRLDSFVKLGDLQNLILYLLADGTGPQWCSVRNRSNVRKVVALMIPGLEADMFNGKIPLLDNSSAEHEDTNGHAASKNTSEQADDGKLTTDAESTMETSSFQTVPSRNPYISPDDYYPRRLTSGQLPAPLQPLSEIFDHVWPVKAPGDDRYSKMHSPLAAMLVAPILRTREEKNIKGPKPPAEGKNWKNQRTPITEFIASTQELVEEGYVLHPAHETGTILARKEDASVDGWVHTLNVLDLISGDVTEMNIEKGSILAGRTVLALDCEMCITSPPGTTPQIYSLTRISLIDWNGKTVMDELVKPEQPITDYLTPYSGITPAMLEGVTTSLQDIQRKLITKVLTPQTILIGHSLNSDLNALKLTHPYIIDTALLFPHPRGPPLKSSLKWLAQKYLSREIQKGHGTSGHDSIEDAQACLDLVKQKCEKGKLWGTSEASGESIFKRLGRQLRPQSDKTSLVSDSDSAYRTGAVVDWGEPTRGYGAQASVAIGCESDDQVISGVKRAIQGDVDNAAMPSGGVDFVFGRLRELEAYRGWWNRSKTADNDELRNSTNAHSSSESLASVTRKVVAGVQEIWESLPPCTAFIVYSGSGDPRDLSEMQNLQRTFKEEYRVKKWDELSIKWTDVEEQKLRRACSKARRGIGFIAVK